MLTQMVANSSMQFHTLAKDSALNSEEYAAAFSILIKEFKNRFEDCKTKSSIYVCDTFSVNTNT